MLPLHVLHLIMESLVGTFSVKVQTMRVNEIQEQIRRCTCDAQLLLIMDRKRAWALLLQQQITNPLRGFTQLPSVTLQKVYDDAFFDEL
jgi:hypothetical protein